MSARHRFSMGYSVTVALLSTLILMSCKAREDIAVAGPSYCASLDIESLGKEADAGSLEAARSVRDYYIECDGARNSERLIHWAEVAASLGDEEDAGLLKELRAVFP